MTKPVRRDFYEETLLEASYEGVEFPITEASVAGGHDLVEHTAYGRRGADIEHTGQQAYEGKLVIPMLNGLAGWGELYPRRYLDLIAKLERVPIGQLTHPTHGLLTAAIKSWKIDAGAEQRSGFVVEVTWIEHDASVSTAGLLAFSGRAVDQTATPATADAQAAAADAAVEAALDE